MSLFKCKMCGGDLEIAEGLTIAECEYCGTKQTVPKAMDENLQNLFNRANTLRIKSEFDKAEKLYEKIIQADTTQSEAYWGLILCKYGIEYVDDPATFKKIPTCHRASYDSIIADDDYKSAIENADLSQRAIYEEQAKEIDRIQKDILALAQKEETYDVFICYKETDANGHRTQDSVIANDIYYQLTNEGFKVFYAAITLEGKLGSAYEPIIFAALNSAKVMLSIGTKPEYFNAVWVKNEWSRFLKIIKKDRSKLLIPCYRDMDAYELPEEFAHLQAQDMAKIGFIADLTRGIKKVIKKDAPNPTTVVKETVITSGNASTSPLLKRAFMFLEDGNWDSADEYCEKVLDIDPECAEAYLGKLLVELKIQYKTNLENYSRPFDHTDNYKKIVRFGNNALVGELKQYNVTIRERNEENRKSRIYNTGANLANQQTPEKQIAAAEEFEKILGYRDADVRAKNCRHQALLLSYDIAMNAMNKATTSQQYAEAAKMFFEIADDYAPAKEKAEECISKSKELDEINRKDSIYYGAIALMDKPSGIINKFSTTNYENAIKEFQKISGWRDSDEKIIVCQKKIEELKAQAEADRLEKERLAEIARIEAEKRAKRNKKIAIITTPIVCAVIAVIAFIIVLNTVIIPNNKYNDAVALMDAGRLDEAYNIFLELGAYKDAVDKASDIRLTKTADIRLTKTKEQLKNIKVGSYINFGAYERDNNTSNGKEDIEWLVLEVKDGKALVISKYALDCQPYNTSYTDVTWKTCTLRKWLNNDFINAAFSADEKAMIPTVTVSADNNPDYSTNPGNATQDQVFLLSITEVNKYFSSDGTRKCKPTNYAVANGAYVNSSNGNCYWWLRSPGEYYPARVNYVGDVCESGYGVGIVNYAVRPALWIDLNS